MYTPHTFGGLEVDPLTFYRVVEAIARIDGSTAWCVWIASGNPVYVGGCLADEGAEAVFGRDPHGITAGVVSPYGRAVVLDGSYLVSGRWPYASACQHCTWLFCCCHVFDSDQMRLTAHGDPEVPVLFVPTTQITIVDTWEVSGLAGPGSHDVVIKQVFVPEAYSGICSAGLPSQSKHFQGLLYRYPFILASGLSLGALALGIAQGAVEMVVELAQAKQPVGSTSLLRDYSLFQVRLAEAVALVRSARAWLYATVQQTWESMRARAEVTFDERADVLLAAAMRRAVPQQRWIWSTPRQGRRRTTEAVHSNGPCGASMQLPNILPRRHRSMSLPGACCWDYNRCIPGCSYEWR